MSQYKYDINYIKGKDNTVANALSRIPDGNEVMMEQVLILREEETMLEDMKKDYKEDLYTQWLLADAKVDLLRNSMKL